jgi:hypothetical protein
MLTLHYKISIRHFKDFVNTYWVYTWLECISFNISAENIQLAMVHRDSQKTNYHIPGPRGERNSQFFQIRVLIEGVRNSPIKIVVIQVPG